MIDIDEKPHTVTINVNGVRQTAFVEARKLLVHLLRDDLGFTGTQIGCDTSQCGACTVDIDGQAVKSCTVLAVMADGSSITTIEGLAPVGSAVHPIRWGQARGHCYRAGCGNPRALISGPGYTHRRRPGPEPC